MIFNPEASLKYHIPLAAAPIGISLIVIALIITPFYLARPGPAVPPSFHQGQMVRMKAFDVEGMVTGSICTEAGCHYHVRVSSIQLSIPNGGLFSSGGPIDFSPVSTVTVHEFEIEAAR